ncbi:hypothetical protein RDWZM_008945 [Blomia tropicalis]|uniref:Protein kinase domain-containing protein n=1 Tax=Blomia tropicalis TaxID=40697 RepID=A0A9Q0M0F8_BLOTA|nr:hypothetical protein RDWZM_008945 [Blomia tropicalis]
MEILVKRGYTEFNRIDSGGQGNVYRTTKDGHVYAIKVIPVIDRDAQLDNDLKRELSISKSLHHPNCIQIKDLFRTKTRVYLVMDFMPNGTIGNLVRKEGPLCEWNTKAWFCPIAKAVSYLHANMIAHRDLKLDNILLDTNYNPIVADFGFARIVEYTAGRLNKSDTFCGTMSYSPPEILKQVRYNPFACDVWSLGVILFTMINQMYPFDRKEGANRMYERMLARDYHLQPQIEQKVSLELQDLIRIILEPDPKRRPSIGNVCEHPWFPIILHETKYLNMDNVRENGKWENSCSINNRKHK